MLSSSRQNEDENNTEESLTTIPEPGPLASHTRFVTTTGGVQVSLVLAVITHHNASSGLIYQQTTVKWTFSAPDGHFAVFVQEPTPIFRSVTFPAFKSCAVTLLKIISRRSVDWPISNKWIWAMRTVNKEVARTASKELNYHEEKENENEYTTKEAEKEKWTIYPRYLDYERTWAYSSKRKENLERRRLQQRKH